MAKTLVIYHANCLDGFGAATAAYRHFLEHGIEAEYYPAKHGHEPPECQGRDVYIVDFSYRRETLKRICSVAKQVTILDHHITAQDDLDGLSDEYDNLTVVFDMDRSGAVITWEHLHTAPVPQLLLHVQDRDLWRFKLEGTDEINTALMSHPFDFEFWLSLINDPKGLEKLKSEGETLNRYRRQLVDQYKMRAVLGTIAGYQIPVVNAPHAIISELVGELAEGHPFAAGYQDMGTRRSWSLRSRKDGGVDVARVAELFGGGGHRNAAGFSTEISMELLRLEPE